MHIQDLLIWGLGACLCGTLGTGLGFTFGVKRFSFWGGTKFATCILMIVAALIFLFARNIGLIGFVDGFIALGMMIGTIIGVRFRPVRLAPTRHTGWHTHRPYHPPAQERVSYEQQGHLLF